MQTIQTKSLENGRPLHIDGEELRDDAGKLVAREMDPANRYARRAAEMLRGRPFVQRDLGPRDVSVGRIEATFQAKSPMGVADDVAPVRLVGHSEGRFFGETLDDATKQATPDTAAGGAAVPEIFPNFTGVSYSTTPRALTCRVPREVVGNSDYDFTMVAIDRLASAQRLAREIRVATMMQTSGNWASAAVQTIAAAAKWNGGASADPLSNIFTGRAASLLPVTAIILPETLEQWLYTNGKMSTFTTAGGQLPSVYAGRMRKIVSGAPAYVWGNHVVLICEPESEASIGTAVTLRWLPELRTGEHAFDGVIVRQFHTGDVGPRGQTYATMILNDCECMLSNQLGALILNAYQ